MSQSTGKTVDGLVKPALFLLVGLLFGKQLSSTPREPAPAQSLVVHQPTVTASDVCLAGLPEWVRDSHSDTLRNAFTEYSNGLTDKGTRHHYPIMYHRYLSPMVLRSCIGAPQRPVKFRMLEIGLGCSPGGGMNSEWGEAGEPGGSTRAWRQLFDSEMIELDLHVMEYDGVCAEKWERQHPGVATKVHTGDASSKEDLERVYRESGGTPFDMIIDDASHMNEHQIATLELMIGNVAKGGIYVIEDIQSACSNWVANIGSQEKGQNIGGTPGCMETRTGAPTIFSKLIEWQKPLLQQGSPFPDVTSIDLQFEAAVISKQY